MTPSQTTLESIADATPEKRTTLTLTTDSALGHKRFPIPFRGILPDVRPVTGDYRSLAERSNLNWKVWSMPVFVHGKTTNKEAEGYQALVRGDNGDILTIASKGFKIHQNPAILGDIEAIADAGKAEIIYAGPMDGGRKIAAVARLDGSFSLPNQREASQHERDFHGNDPRYQNNDDTTYLFVVITGGHEVGTPLKVTAIALREWCGNGAFFATAAKSSARVTHRCEIGSQVNLTETFDSMRREFGHFSVASARLQATEADRDQQRLYVAELLKPGFAAELATRTGVQSPIGAYDSVNKSYQASVLETMLKAQDDASATGFKRTYGNLLDAIVNQDAANGDNLWTAYNGITSHVDHVRGRSPETGVDAALFGAGAAMKERALAVAMEFAR